MIPYGEKTGKVEIIKELWFESSVIPYGEKTNFLGADASQAFESSVIPYVEKFNICTKTLRFIY